MNCWTRLPGWWSRAWPTTAWCSCRPLTGCCAPARSPTPIPLAQRCSLACASIRFPRLARCSPSVPTPPATTQLSPDVAAEMPAWARAEPDTISIVKLMRPHSAIATPLLAAQGPLGVIVLGRGAGRARFTETDVQMVEELGRRLAVGLANADDFAREHAIAETLQRSLLPDALPQIPGLDLAVRYLPATEGADVGGDWYDAFPLQGGRIGLVTGDVAGHSITSASIMGQVRSLLRGYAIDDPDPGRVLGRANTALAQLLPDVLASAVYAVLDPATGDLTYANAGHPPPLLATGTGQAEYLDDTAGTMLGACPGTSFTTGHRLLQPGARLLLLHRRAHRRPAPGYLRRPHHPGRDAATLRAQLSRADMRHRARRAPGQRTPRRRRMPADRPAHPLNTRQHRSARWSQGRTPCAASPPPVGTDNPVTPADLVSPAGRVVWGYKTGHPVPCQNSRRASDLGFYPRHSCSPASPICS